ncbi:MAG: hypothetical protein ABSH10_02670 [Phycisphaerae bacterium]|jgi:hypothetical protein
MPSFDNPFTVQSPEDLPAEEVVALFVPVFGDFPKVPRMGHVFLHGPRGSGKSMIFRYLQPDCQLLVNGKSRLSDLEHYSVYVPLKNCDLKITELRRLEGQHASVILNEHFMVLYIATKAFASLSTGALDNLSNGDVNATRSYCESTFVSLLRRCGLSDGDVSFEGCATARGYILRLQEICERLFGEVRSYLRKLAFTKEPMPFNGPLCGYLDFLLPALKALNALPFMPGPDKPVFLLVDDADNLNLTQTKILNSWVSSRTSSVISIKVSTQMQYKTYHTVTGQTIDTPHDYSEVNISTVYTAGGKAKYRERVGEVVSKRLKLFSISASPEEFFPCDDEQEARIREIADKYKLQWEESGRGYRPVDDAYRYARPDYIRSLAGPAKSSYTYSYAGFDQLVHISSGVIRYFLEAAAQMYSTVRSHESTYKVGRIPPGIQNDVVRDQANAFLFEDLEKIRDDAAEEAPEEAVVSGLHRLIRSLGGLFREILLSSRSERRVFSVAFLDAPSERLREAFKLGIRYGYFHVSTIGNKEGTGRTRLYILSRRLAPLFTLDPTSFAGYLFMRSSLLENALQQDPDSFLRTMEKRIRGPGADDVLEERQLKLFD